MSFFFAIQARKMCSTIFQNKKTPFQPIKTTGLKSRKIEIFAKGLTHSFGQKMAIFPFLFFAIQARKMCFTIFQKKKTSFQPIKTTRSKRQKIHSFIVSVKKWPFFHVFFLGKIGQKNVFYNILERKNAFLANKKKRSSKSRKIEIFPKRLTYAFGQKMAIFPCFFFFFNVGQENVFYNILEQKNTLLAYKNNTFKKSKN